MIVESVMLFTLPIFLYKSSMRPATPHLHMRMLKDGIYEKHNHFLNFSQSRCRDAFDIKLYKQ